MPWKHNGKVIREGRAWTDSNGVTHPRQWARWPDADKTAMGLVWEDAPASEAPFDSEFYTGRQADGTLIEKALTDVNEVDDDGNARTDIDGNQVVTLGLKSEAKKRVKQTAADKLAKTDWYVIRKAEDSTATIPAAVTTYRTAVRTASNTIETAIDNAADHAAFMALYNVPTDDDGNATGNAPINDWPDEL